MNSRIDCITDEEIPPERLAIIPVGDRTEYIDIQSLYQYHVTSKNAVPTNPLTTLPLDADLAARVLNYGKSLEVTMIFYRSDSGTSVRIKSLRPEKLGWFIAEYYHQTDHFPEGTLHALSIYKYLKQPISAPVTRIDVNSHSSMTYKIYDYDLIAEYQHTYPADRFRYFDDLLFSAQDGITEHCKLMAEFSVRTILACKAGRFAYARQLLHMAVEDDSLWLTLKHFAKYPNTIFDLYPVQEYSALINFYHRLADLSARSTLCEEHHPFCVKVFQFVVDYIISLCQPTCVRDLFSMPTTYISTRDIMNAALLELSSGKLKYYTEICEVLNTEMPLCSTRGFKSAFVTDLSYWNDCVKDPIKHFFGTTRIGAVGLLASTKLFKNYLRSKKISYPAKILVALQAELKKDKVWREAAITFLIA